MVSSASRGFGVVKPGRSLTWEQAETVRTEYRRVGGSINALATKYGVHWGVIKGINLGAAMDDWDEDYAERLKVAGEVTS